MIQTKLDKLNTFLRGLSVPMQPPSNRLSTSQMHKQSELSYFATPLARQEIPWKRIEAAGIACGSTTQFDLMIRKILWLITLGQQDASRFTE